MADLKPTHLTLSTFDEIVHREADTDVLRSELKALARELIELKGERGNDPN